MQEVTNFSRFYTLLRHIRLSNDEEREEFKRNAVSQFTGGRTESLREIRKDEYAALCSALENLTGKEQAYKELKRHRSIVLKLMQELGIETTDWARVDSFCQHPRIAGKPFRMIDTEELETLAVKLRSIKRKGGVKPQPTQQEQKNAITYICVPLTGMVES